MTCSCAFPYHPQMLTPAVSVLITSNCECYRGKKKRRFVLFVVVCLFVGFYCWKFQKEKQTINKIWNVTLLCVLNTKQILLLKNVTIHCVDHVEYLN